MKRLYIQYMHVVDIEWLLEVFAATMDSANNALRVCERWTAVNNIGDRRKEKRPLVSLAEIGSGALAGISRHVFVLMLISSSKYMHF